MANDFNHEQKSLNECNDKSVIQPVPNLDRPPPFCNNPGEPNLRQPAGRPDLGWLEDVGTKKTGFGASANCDPMSAGRIINDPNDPNPEVSYRYARSIRGTDEAVMDLFTNLVVLDGVDAFVKGGPATGTLVQAGVMLAGGISTTDTPPTLDPGAIPGELLALHATGFLWLGLLAVIATPTARIVVALIGYLRGGEREMAVISAAILAVITLSVILARLVEA